MVQNLIHAQEGDSSAVPAERNVYTMIIANNRKCVKGRGAFHDRYKVDGQRSSVPLLQERYGSKHILRRAVAGCEHGALFPKRAGKAKLGGMRLLHNGL